MAQAPLAVPSTATTTLGTTDSTSNTSSLLVYLQQITIPKVMIKLWPTAAMDQLTPRAEGSGHGQERNPFDLHVNTSTPSTPTAYHPLLNTHPSPFIPQHDAAPLASPSIISGLPAALPTTQLSLHAPDFNMQQPPSVSRKALSNMPTVPSPSPASHPHAASSSKGQIHVKLISARGLHVRGVHARPYVVVQFEQNEFVSRDPTDETDKEVKGTATNLSRNSSSNAISALGAIGSKAAAAAMDATRRGKASRNTSPTSSISSGSGKSSLAPGSNLFGRLSAHNPVWKHEVSL